jgi:hypothetical protein
VNPATPTVPPPPSWFERLPRGPLQLRLLLLALGSALLLLAAQVAAGGGLRGLAAGLGAVAGLAVASHARAGWPALVASLAALLILPVQSGSDGVASTGMVLGLCIGIWGLVAALRRSAFDWRLERARDLAWLLAAAAVCALVLGLALPLGVSGVDKSALARVDGTSQAVTAALVWVAFLASSLTVCSLRPLERRPPMARAGAMLALVVLLLSAVLAPGLSSPWRWLEATLMVIERDADGTPLRLLATWPTWTSGTRRKSASGCRSACSSTCTKAC